MHTNHKESRGQVEARLVRSREMGLGGRSERVLALVACDAKPALKGEECDGTPAERMLALLRIN